MWGRGVRGVWRVWGYLYEKGNLLFWGKGGERECGGVRGVLEEK